MHKQLLIQWLLQIVTVPIEVNMQEKEKEAYPGRMGKTSSKVVHDRCLKRLDKAVQKSVLQAIAENGLLF